MKTTLTPEEAASYRDLAAYAQEIETALQSLALATMRSPIPDKAKTNILDWVKRADTFRGLSYFLTPQPEWTGGDSSDPANTVMRPPHIAK